MTIKVHHTIEPEDESIPPFDVTVTAECLYERYYAATRFNPEEGGYFNVESMKVVRDDTSEDVTETISQEYIDSFEEDVAEKAMKKLKAGLDS